MNFKTEEIIKLQEEEIKKEMQKVFIDLYGDGEEIFLFKTAFVMTIAGEQIGYTGGSILMAKMNKNFFVAIRKTNSDKVSYTDMNSKESFEFTLEKNSEEDIKAKILFSIIQEFKNRNYEINSGFEILTLSTVGIETLNYANFEATSALSISSLFNFKTDEKELAEISAQSERAVINTKYGASEHFCILSAKENNAIFLDTKSYKYEAFNFNLTDYDILLLAHNRDRESVCNIRRVECEEGLRILRKKIDIDNLCEITKADYEYYKTNFFDKTIQKRVKHCVTENARVHKALEILKEDEVDVEALGKIFCETHISLRNNYELVQEEQNELFESAIIQCGCRGAKMTGYDFYDISLAIVKKNNIEEFSKELRLAYSEKSENDLIIFSALSE